MTSCCPKINPTILLPMAYSICFRRPELSPRIGHTALLSVPHPSHTRALAHPLPSACRALASPYSYFLLTFHSQSEKKTNNTSWGSHL